jgi:hypothetical protein
VDVLVVYLGLGLVYLGLANATDADASVKGVRSTGKEGKRHQRCNACSGNGTRRNKRRHYLIVSYLILSYLIVV